jgi:hypothetical protein
MRPTALAPALFFTALVACSRPQGEPTAREAPLASPPAAARPPDATLRPNAAPNAAPNAPAAGRAGPPRAGCEGLFDPPEGAVKLCDEHVMADRAEIHWTSWAVTTSRLDTFQTYRARTTECGASATFKPPLLNVSKGDQRLSIHEAGETGYPACAVKPDAARPTVVVISTKHDR